MLMISHQRLSLKWVAGHWSYDTQTDRIRLKVSSGFVGGEEAILHCKQGSDGCAGPHSGPWNTLSAFTTLRTLPQNRPAQHLFSTFIVRFSQLLWLFHRFVAFKCGKSKNVITTLPPLVVACSHIIAFPLQTGLHLDLWCWMKRRRLLLSSIMDFSPCVPLHASFWSVPVRSFLPRWIRFKILNFHPVAGRHPPLSTFWYGNACSEAHCCAY